MRTLNLSLRFAIGNQETGGPDCAPLKQTPSRASLIWFPENIVRKDRSLAVFSEIRLRMLRFRLSFRKTKSGFRKTKSRNAGTKSGMAHSRSGSAKLNLETPEQNLGWPIQDLLPQN